MEYHLINFRYDISKIIKYYIMPKRLNLLVVMLYLKNYDKFFILLLKLFFSGS